MNRFKRGLIIVIVMITICLVFSTVDAKESNEQVILVVIDTLSFSDESIYDEISGFDALQKYAAKGALNIKSSGATNAENSYLSIGGGSRANGIKGKMGEAYLVNEIVDDKVMAGEVHEWQSGEQFNVEDGIVFIPIEKLKLVAQKFSYETGRLGNLLKEHGKTSKIYGNTDTDVKRRLAPLITIDEKGFTSGDIGNDTLVKDSSRPYGIRTNYEYLNKKYIESVDNNISLVVFDLGDLYRLNLYRDYMSADYALKVKTEILSEIGNFVNDIYENINDNQTLMVVSPMVSSEARKNKELLAPIWMYSKNKTGNIITSGTTRREGIVANIDIAPTIQAILVDGNMNSKMDGHILKVKEANIDFQQLLDHTFNVYKLRPKVLSNYILYQIIILVVAIIFLFKKKKSISSWLHVLLLSTLYIPLLMLVTAKLNLNNPYIYLLLIIILSVFLAMLSNKHSPHIGLFIVSLATFSCITLDVMLGSPLQRSSFLGYDPIIGARYYGIGNEYMGYYIGATILFIATILDRKSNNFNLIISIIVSAIAIFTIAHPLLGTNAGGALASIVAISIFFIKKINLSRKKKILLFIAALVILTTAFIYANMSVGSENKSHIGAAINQISEGDYATIFKTISRKLSMNIKLIQTSSWGMIIFTSLISWAIITLVPKTRLNRELRLKNKIIFTGFFSIFVGAITALLVNDSGVVAASTMIIFLIVPMLYLKFKF